MYQNSWRQVVRPIPARLLSAKDGLGVIEHTEKRCIGLPESSLHVVRTKSDSDTTLANASGLGLSHTERVRRFG
jgi:hypothetical protein